MPARSGQMAADPAVDKVEVPVAEPTVVVQEVEEVSAPDEELDPTTPLFDGGPTLEEVEGWKRQYGDVYVTSFGLDEHYVWRTITRFEYRRLVTQLEQQVASGQVGQAEANLNNEEAICELCILFPRSSRADMAQDNAGVASIISQEVMEASSFVALEVRQL